MLPIQSDKSILLITLDSCRYDTFVSSDASAIKAVGPLHRAMAPGNFTYASHSAIFVGFTPGVADLRQPFANPKIGRIFRLSGSTAPAKGSEHFVLEGRTIIEGLKREGYKTYGTGGVRWLDPHTPTGAMLVRDFDEFAFFAYHGLQKQMQWIETKLPRDGQPVMVFVNVGETHVPYWHEGAAWSKDDNPCISYGQGNDLEKCRQRQRACLEYADRQLAPLIEAFARSNIVICADHGDAWGEDGLWEHSIHHEKVLEVPLLYRLATGVKHQPKPAPLPKLPTTFRTPKVVYRTPPA